LNLILASTTKRFETLKPYYLSRRGDRNVPVRYLKAVYWAESSNPAFTGYTFFDGENAHHVEFNFENHCWVEVTYSSLGWNSQGKPCPAKWGLDIADHEIVDRSAWGQIDGQEDPEASPEVTKSNPIVPPSNPDNDLYQDPENIDIKIPTTDLEEQQEQAIESLASSIPTFFRAPSRKGTTRDSTPTIMATLTQTQTTTRPNPLVTRPNPLPIFSSSLRRTGGGDGGGGGGDGGGGGGGDDPMGPTNDDVNAAHTRSRQGGDRLTGQA
jgi:hypothetical protein